MANIRFCSATNQCITCEGVYATWQEARKIIEEAQEKGDKSFLCCNTGGKLKCLRVDQIVVIEEIPAGAPPDDYSAEDYKQR